MCTPDLIAFQMDIFHLSIFPFFTLSNALYFLLHSCCSGIMAFGTSKVECDMQSMCENTVAQILEEATVAQKMLELRRTTIGNIIWKFLFKFGSDDSGDQPKFRQLLDADHVAGALYSTFMTAMQIVAELPCGKVVICYDNPLVNSPLACRPLILWFIKESVKTIKDVYNDLDKQRKALLGFDWLEGIHIEFCGYYAMCDMKVLNGIIENPRQNVCPICFATPNEVNDLDRDFEPLCYHALSELCLSILHFAIRVFEHLIKVGARVKAGVCEFPAYGAVKQGKIGLAKDRIIKQFKDEMDMDIFQVRPGGGTSNTGNVARDALSQHEFMAKVTGLSVELIKRLDYIRISLASVDELEKAPFVQYCKDTKAIYVRDCGWYPANPTLHKIFDHPDHFLQFFPPTITTGMVSEEGSEATNKIVRRFQLEHAFQGSAQQRGLDTFNRLCDLSSPRVLVHLQDTKVNRRTKEPLPLEVQQLMKQK